MCRTGSSTWLWGSFKMQVPEFRLLFLVTCTLCLASFLSACGFAPLYGTGGASGEPVATDLSQIYIENIPDREGQYLRNALLDRLYQNGRPENALYRLSIAPVIETRTDLDITKSSDATRAQLRLVTVMVLTDKTTGTTLLQRSLTGITSYNILHSQFTTRVSEDNARRNALDDLARQIEQQLALYFRRQ